MPGMDSGTQRAPEVEATTLTDLAGAWLFTHRSWNTRAAYEADLAGFAAWCSRTGRSPLRVTRDEIERFCTDCEDEGAGAATTRRRLAALTSFFDFAVTTGDAIDNPAQEVSRPENSDGGSPAELEEGEARALLGAAEELGPKAAVLVALLLLDGLKLGEALGVDIDDLRVSPPSVTVRRHGRGQSIPLQAATATAIDGYAASRTSGPLLLGNGVGEPARLTRSGAHHILKRAGAQAGITKTISANTLRRSYAANAHADGVSLDEIRANLGHFDRRTTRRLLPENP